MEEEKRAYLTVGSTRLLNIRVIQDDEYKRYEGIVENAPQEIKKLIYSKMENRDKVIFYVYSEFNQL